MKQVVIFEKPPIFDRIAAVFDVVDKPIIFSWGDRIYNPEHVDITKELFAHESVHGERQGNDEASVLAWWEKYLVDPQFRFDEELPAHRAEYLALVKRHSDKRTKYLQYVAEKLSAPLYGSLVTIDQAKSAIERAPVIHKDQSGVTILTDKIVPLP